MTSKNLFLKLQREDMKRRVWSVALSMLSFFLLYTVVCAMKVSNYAYRIKTMGEYDPYVKEWVYNDIIKFIGPANELVIIITIICAVVCGLSGFFYLHSKKKVDLFHSIPVKRENLFAVTYLNGLLIYIVPYLISLLVCFIILAANKYMVMEVFLTGLMALGVNILYYTFIYTIAIVAVMLTGNIVVSFLGAGVFYLYGSFIVGINDLYFSEFFKTYFTINNTEEMIINMSPLGNYINIAGKIADGYGREAIGTIVSVIVATIALIAFAIFLYRKRPSEAAGKAMAFGISKAIIKLALVIPISLAGGILFMNISNSHDIAWLIFGLIFALVISYGIIEIIYNFDLHKAFHRIYYLIGSALAVAVIVCIFQFDIFKYDTYIPKKDNIETMSLSISGLDGHIRYYDFDNINSRNSYNSNYQLENVKIDDVGPSYELVKIGIEQFMKDKKTDILYEMTDSGLDSTKYYIYKVMYTLDNGRRVYREYTLPVDQTYDIIQDVYRDLDYKKGHFPINQWNKDIIDMIDMISCSNTFEDKEFSLDELEKNKLIEMYKSELNNLSLDDIVNYQPIATLTFGLNDYNFNYYVYPTFENTITFLNDHGFDGTRVVETQDIKEILVNNLDIELDNEEAKKRGAIYETRAVDSISATDTLYVDEEGKKIYKDPEDIKEIYSSLIVDDYYWDNNSFINVENSIEVILTINRDNYGNYITKSYYFKVNEIPEFVKEDISYK